MFSKMLKAITHRQPSSRIAFERTGEHVPGCPTGIYTIAPDGSDSRLVRHSGNSPRWSPDGRWIAFSEATRENDNLQNVFIMRPDGENAQCVTPHRKVEATPPSWSPDSKYLVYSLWLWQDHRYELCVTDLATRQPRHLLFEEEAIYPVWAHTGKIMFSRFDGGRILRLFEVDPGGRRVQEAPAFEPGDSEPSWTPDGSRVVFGRDTGVAVADTATGRVCHSLPGNRAIQWTIAPDGQSIAYACQMHGTNTGFEIFVCDLNRQSIHQLVSNPIVRDHEVDSRYVSWSPWL